MWLPPLLILHVCPSHQILLQGDQSIHWLQRADRQSQVLACRRLVEQGRAEIIALTLGSEGALLVTRDAAWFSEPLPVKVMSSVGAGDSFLGGLIWSLSTGSDLKGALRHAVAAGSAALLAPGTQLCRPEDVRRLSPQVRIVPV